MALRQEVLEGLEISSCGNSNRLMDMGCEERLEDDRHSHSRNACGVNGCDLCSFEGVLEAR